MQRGLSPDATETEQPEADGGATIPVIDLPVLVGDDRQPTRVHYDSYVKIKGVWHVRVPWTPPERYAPLRTATRMRIKWTPSARTLKAQVRAWLSTPDAQAEDEYALPTPARSFVKRLVSEGAAYEVSVQRPAFECVLTYARGYALTDSGEMYRKVIWAQNTPSAEDPRKRYQVGHEDPAPVDSVLVRGVWRDTHGRLTRVLGAYWTDGTFDNALDWTRESDQHGRSGARLLTATQLKEA